MSEHEDPSEEPEEPEEDDPEEDPEEELGADEDEADEDEADEDEADEDEAEEDEADEDEAEEDEEAEEDSSGEEETEEDSPEDEEVEEDSDLPPREAKKEAKKKVRSTRAAEPDEVAPGRRIALLFRLKDAGSGALLAQSEEGEPLTITFEKDRLLPGFEEALLGKREGEELRLTLDPKEAFGAPEKGTERRFHRGDFPAGVPIGPRFPFEAEGSDGEPAAYWVTEVKGDWVTADRNHPWSGLSIDVYAQVLQVGRPGRPV